MLIELGSASDDGLVAAALLWRVFYSVITLPLGALTLARFRKANRDVLTELRLDCLHAGRPVVVPAVERRRYEWA